MTEAVIFDIDGTLLDSVDFHAHAWQEAFAHFGRQIPFDEIRGQIGKGGDQLLPVFLDEKERKEMGHDLEAFRSSLFKKKYLPQVKPFPGVRELFQPSKRTDSASRSLLPRKETSSRILSESRISFTAMPASSFRKLKMLPARINKICVQVEPNRVGPDLPACRRLSRRRSPIARYYRC